MLRLRHYSRAAFVRITAYRRWGGVETNRRSWVAMFFLSSVVVSGNRLTDWRPYLPDRDRDIKAKKLDVLLFIRRWEIVTIWDLIEQFGYTYKGAQTRMHRLKTQKLVEQLDRGQWILTNDGYTRLDYYGI